MASQAANARHAILYRMVMPDHICPFGLKALHLLKRSAQIIFHDLAAVEHQRVGRIFIAPNHVRWPVKINDTFDHRIVNGVGGRKGNLSAGAAAQQHKLR